MQKLRVGVLMGGKSIEREVSFSSGRTVCDHLDAERYEAIPLFQTLNGMLFILPWHFLHRGKISDFEHRLVAETQQVKWDDLKKIVDFVYIATHGRYAEDGTLQGFLEILGIPYLGSKIFSSALGMDKAVQKEFLRSANIDVPCGIALTPYEVKELSTSEIIKKIQDANVTFPVVVKPHLEGSSLGITVVFEESSLPQALIKACHADPNKEQLVLVEEKIEGMEFTAVLLTDAMTNTFFALPLTQVIPEEDMHFYDYEQKYMPGRATKLTPALCSQEVAQKIKATVIEASKVLGFTTMSRIDGFYTDDGRVVLFDANSLSGMAPAGFIFNQAAEANMSHTQLINHLMETELQSYGMLESNQAYKRNESMNIPKIRVAVLMGGSTFERETALNSGRNVTYKLSPHKYEVIPLFVSSKNELFRITQQHLVRNATHEIESLVTPAMQVLWNDLPTITDFVFIGLHGGVGENGGVQGALEMLGLPYNGSAVLTSALCMDKYKTNQYLRSKGFAVGEHMLVECASWEADKNAVMKNIIATLPLPLIVKPSDDGCSVMVAKIKKSEDLEPALQEIFDSSKTNAMVEEFIVGMELTVGVIGNQNPRALPPSHSVTTSDILTIEEKFLPGAGENQTPAPLPADTLLLVQRTMEQVYVALGCKGYARIDCFYQTAQQSPTGQERVVILEINTLPALTPATCLFHQAAEVGIKPMDFIDMLVEFGLEEHRKGIPVAKESLKVL